MLQASHEELYAWHAVVAIGALQRTLEIANCSNDTTESKRHHTVTLKQYGIALKYMREVVQREMNEYRLRETLISCLLTKFLSRTSATRKMHLRKLKPVSTS